MKIWFISWTLSSPDNSRFAFRFCVGLGRRFLFAKETAEPRTDASLPVRRSEYVFGKKIKEQSHLFSMQKGRSSNFFFACLFLFVHFNKSYLRENVLFQCDWAIFWGKMNLTWCPWCRWVLCGNGVGRSSNNLGSCVPLGQRIIWRSGIWRILVWLDRMGTGKSKKKIKIIIILK